MPLTAWAAGWFLLAAAPLALFVSFSDLARMKIPNVAVLAMLAAYAVLGLVALPFGQYLWHWTHAPILLVIGFVLNAAGAMGAGDAKYIAAAAPMVAVADATLMVLILAAALLAGFVTHRIFKHTRLRNIAPGWESWDSGKRFPMGFPLSMALCAYLVTVLILR